MGPGLGGGIGAGTFVFAGDRLERFPGQIGGVVVDPSGAVVSGAHVTVTNSERGVTMNAVSDAEGRWVVSNFPGGRGKIQVDANGFKTLVQQMNYDAGRAAEYLSTLNVGATTETIEVSAEAVTAPMSGRSYSTPNWRKGQQSRRRMPLPQTYSICNDVAGSSR